MLYYPILYLHWFCLFYGGKVIHLPGVGAWTLFFTGQAIGNIFIGIRPYIGQFISIHVGNLLIIGSSIFLILGLSRFFNRQIPKWYITFTIIVLSIMTALFFIFTEPIDHMTQRILVAGLSNSVLLSLSLVFYWNQLKTEDRKRFPVFGWLMSAEVLLLFFRTLSVLFFPIQKAFPFNQINSYLLIILNDVSIMLYTVPIVMLVNRTLIEELLEYKNNLEALVKSRTEEVIHAEKLASLGHISAGLAHEINNPNNNIKLNGEYLAKGLEVLALEEIRPNLPGNFPVGRITLDQFIRNAPNVVTEILDNSYRVDSIVLSLKEYANPSKEDKLELLDLNETVLKAIKLVDKYAQKHTIVWEHSLSFEPLWIIGFGSKIEHILVNLVQNSCNALTSNKQAVRVSTGTVGTECFLKVEDEGQGIDSENLSLIFDPFFTTRRQFGGSGLGLTVVKRLVNEMQAKIEVGSVVKKGTDMTVWFKTADCKQ